MASIVIVSMRASVARLVKEADDGVSSMGTSEGFPDLFAAA